MRLKRNPRKNILPNAHKSAIALGEPAPTHAAPAPAAATVSAAEIRQIAVQINDLKARLSAPAPKTRLEQLASQAEALFSSEDLSVFAAEYQTQGALENALATAVQTKALPGWIKTKAGEARYRKNVQDASKPRPGQFAYNAKSKTYERVH